MKIYHVAPKGLTGLKSLYEQFGEAAYDMYVERWPDANELAFAHAHYIHCHNTINEAVDYMQYNGDDDSVVYVVDVDDDLVCWDNLEYKHPVIEHSYDINVIKEIENKTGGYENE